MEVLDLGTDRLMDLEEQRCGHVYRKLTDLPSNQGPDHEVFIGIEKKLEDNTMFYREPVQIDKPVQI